MKQFLNKLGLAVATVLVGPFMVMYLLGLAIVQSVKNIFNK